MFAILHVFPGFPNPFAAPFGKIGLRKAAILTMSRQPEAHLSTIERIERALVVLAYFIELDGDVHVPMYEKFEAELAELRKKEDTKARRPQSAAVLHQCRRLEGDLLKVLELEFQRWAFAILRLVGLVPHQAIDQAVRRLGSHEPRVCFGFEY